jgi:hypothetical protein
VPLVAVILFLAVYPQFALNRIDAPRFSAPAAQQVASR